MKLVSRLAALARNLFRTRPRRARPHRRASRLHRPRHGGERRAMACRRPTPRGPARVELGGVEQVKEDVRDVRTGAALDVFVRDITVGVRALGRTPAFTLAATLALALGIGATTAMLSVVNACPSPSAAVRQRRPPRRVHARRTESRVAGELHRLAAADAHFSAMAAAEYWTPNLTGADEPEHLNGCG